MSEVTASIRNHHDRLLRDLPQQSAEFTAEPSQPNSTRLLALLRDDLVKHAEDEEREYVDWIEAALRSLPDATSARRELLLSQLKRYLTQLEAVLNLHLEKEERLFLPMIERHLPLVEQRRMLAAMHGAPAINAPADPPRRNQPTRRKNSRAPDLG